VALLKRFKSIIYAQLIFVNGGGWCLFLFFRANMRKRIHSADNDSMRNLIFMLLILASVLLALLLWSPELSTGDHPEPALASAGMLR